MPDAGQQQQLQPSDNPTWIQTTHGGSNTNIEQTYDEAMDRLLRAHTQGDPVVEFTVKAKHAGGLTGRYRRLFVVAHIVQVGDTVSEAYR